MAPDIEILSERRFDADFDVVEVDEYGDVEAILLWQNYSLSGLCRSRNGGVVRSERES